MVVARTRNAHELHPTAGGHEGTHEQRILLSPGKKIRKLRCCERRVLTCPDDLSAVSGACCQLSHSRAPFFQQYARATARAPMKADIVANPVQPRSLKSTAQGYMKTTSISNTTKRIAVR